MPMRASGPVNLFWPLGIAASRVPVPFEVVDQLGDERGWVAMPMAADRLLLARVNRAWRTGDVRTGHVHQILSLCGFGAGDALADTRGHWPLGPHTIGEQQQASRHADHPFPAA
jgi:hypothetical protein